MKPLPFTALIDCPRCNGDGAIYAVIGEKIRDRRKALGLGLREVARLAGISAAYLSDIELDRRTCPDATLEKVIAAMARKALAVQP